MRIFCVLLLAALSYSSAVQGEEQQDYFPLQVGNSWTYKKAGTSEIVTTRVVGSATVEDKSYFLVKDYFLVGIVRPDTVLLREEGNKVFYYFNGEEVVLYDFSAPIRASWDVPLYFFMNQLTDVPISRSYATPTCAVFLIGWDRQLNLQETFTLNIGRTHVIPEADYVTPPGRPIWQLQEAMIGGKRHSYPGEDQQNYFPLKVGNRWTYRRVQGTEEPEIVTTEVIGSSVVEGKQYFLMKDYFVPGAVLPDTVFLRKDGDKVFLYLNGEEHLFYDFSPSASDSDWYVPMYDDPTYRRLDLFWVYVAFSRPECIVFGFSRWEEVFGPGIGKVSVSLYPLDDYRTVWELQEVVVGGNTSVQGTTWGAVKLNFRE